MTAKQHTCFFVNKVSFGGDLEEASAKSGDREAASTFGSDLEEASAKRIIFQT